METIEQRWKKFIRKGKQEKKGIVYLVKNGGFFKIGVTRNLKKRLNTMQTSTPFCLHLICADEVDTPLEIEHTLLHRYKDKRFRGEWFELSSIDVDWVKNYIVKKSCQ